MLRVLVVDDDRDLADSLAQLLRLWGLDGCAAYGSLGALALLASFRPQVAVLDLSLPFIDGPHLAQALRAWPEPPGRLVALTGLGENEMPPGGRLLFDSLLRKPADPDELRALLEGYARELGG